MENFPEKYKYDVTILQQTVQQIFRDTGIEVNLSGNVHSAFHEIKMSLLPVISKLFSSDKIALQNILYRVDIPEKEYKIVLKNPDTEDIPEKLAELIIRRGFQKVVTRLYFSEKNK